MGFDDPHKDTLGVKQHPLPNPAPAPNAYLAVLCDGPDHTDSRGDVHDPIFRPRRLHYGPGTSYQSPKKPRRPPSAKILESKHPTSYYGGWLPFGLFLQIPSLTRAWPSQRVAHIRSWGPQLIWTTSPGVSTRDQEEPSGLGWLTFSRYHT